MADAGVIKWDILDPSTWVLLGSIHGVKLLLSTQDPSSLRNRPEANWMSGEPMRSIWGHLYVMVLAPVIPKSTTTVFRNIGRIFNTVMLRRLESNTKQFVSKIYLIFI